jgi:hypothetical protein
MNVRCVPAVMSLVLAASPALAGKPMFIEIKSVPASTKAALAMLPKEKPGPFRRQLLVAVESKLREKGTPLDDADAIDAMTTALFERVFDEMAAPTDVWAWSGEEGLPRGDVLIRHTVKLLPGQNSTGYLKSFTVSPKGKRIDRAYLNTPCTVDVSVAKNPADWFAEVEGREGWVAALHPVLVSEGVARVALQLLSPGRGEPPAARHERPLWVAFFKQDAAGAPWQLAHFEPYTAVEQKLQESNVLPLTEGKEKLVDQQKQLLLTLRLFDLKLVNPQRKVLSPAELKLVQLDGLTESPVDAKHTAWLEPYRTADVPLVRAVALLRLAQLGATVTGAELLYVLENVRATAVQAEALGALGKLLDASTEAVTDADRAALTRAPDADVKVLKGLARVRAGGKSTFHKQTAGAWSLIAPAK